MTEACSTPLPYNTTAAEAEMWQCANDAMVTAQSALILCFVLLGLSFFLIALLYFAFRPTRL